MHPSALFVVVSCIVLVLYFAFVHEANNHRRNALRSLLDIGFEQLEIANKTSERQAAIGASALAGSRLAQATAQAGRDTVKQAGYSDAAGREEAEAKADGAEAKWEELDAEAAEKAAAEDTKLSTGGEADAKRAELDAKAAKKAAAKEQQVAAAREEEAGEDLKSAKALSSEARQQAEKASLEREASAQLQLHAKKDTADYLALEAEARGAAESGAQAEAASVEAEADATADESATVVLGCVPGVGLAADMFGGAVAMSLQAGAASEAAEAATMDAVAGFRERQALEERAEAAAEGEAAQTARLRAQGQQVQERLAEGASASQREAAVGARASEAKLEEEAEANTAQAALEKERAAKLQEEAAGLKGQAQELQERSASDLDRASADRMKSQELHGQAEADIQKADLEEKQSEAEQSRASVARRQVNKLEATKANIAVTLEQETSLLAKNLLRAGQEYLKSLNFSIAALLSIALPVCWAMCRRARSLGERLGKPSRVVVASEPLLGVSPPPGELATPAGRKKSRVLVRSLFVCTALSIVLPTVSRSVEIVGFKAVNESNRSHIKDVIRDMSVAIEDELSHGNATQARRHAAAEAWRAYIHFEHLLPYVQGCCKVLFKRCLFAGLVVGAMSSVIVLAERGRPWDLEARRLAGEKFVEVLLDTTVLTAALGLACLTSTRRLYRHPIYGTWLMRACTGACAALAVLLGCILCLQFCCCGRPGPRGEEDSRGHGGPEQPADDAEEVGRPEAEQREPQQAEEPSGRVLWQHAAVVVEVILYVLIVFKASLLYGEYNVASVYVNPVLRDLR